MAEFFVIVKFEKVSKWKVLLCYIGGLKSLRVKSYAHRNFGFKKAGWYPVPAGYKCTRRVLMLVLQQKLKCIEYPPGTTCTRRVHDVYPFVYPPGSSYLTGNQTSVPAVYSMYPPGTPVFRLILGASKAVFFKTHIPKPLQNP